MKKIVLNYLMFVALAVAAAFTSCGGGSGSSGGDKSLNGTYISGLSSIIFSGNKIKIVDAEANETMEGIYELVEEYQEGDFSRGILIFTHREGKNEMNYVLEGKGKVLMLNYRILIKEGTNYSRERFSGTYIDERQKFIFFGNEYKVVVDGKNQDEGTYKLFVLESGKEGFSKGILVTTSKNSDQTSNVRYVLDGDKLTIMDRWTLTKE